MAGTKIKDEFKELISPFLKFKLKELRDKFGENSREYQAISKQYVKDSNEKPNTPLETSNSIIHTWNGKKIINMRVIHKTKGRAPITICAGCNKTGVEYKY